MGNLVFENIGDLKRAVEYTCACKASYMGQVAMIEKYGEKTIWKGIVYIFRIIGHPQTDICYAWSSPMEGSSKRRYYTVLKIPPIDSPEKAVRAALVRDYKQE
jgi:hypothetical protein